MIHLYSFDVDFQRDIQPGDKFEVLYESQFTEDGQFVRLGEVKYAQLTLGKVALPLYWYKFKNGDVDYFNQKNEVRRLYALRKPYRGHCFPNLLTDYCLCLSTCMIRKSSLDALDIWFDESLNVCEESDLFLRIGLKSKIDFIPDVLAKYRVHDENWTSRDPELIIRESELILEKLNTLPEVQEHHADAMILAQHQLARQEAKLAWRQGNSAQARQIIRDKIPLTLSSKILFVATL